MHDASRAIEIEPRSEIAYTTRGQLYAHQANYIAAIADFTRAIELNPKFRRAYYARGRSYQFSGKPDLAIRDFETMVSLDPLSPDGYGGLGISLRNSGRTSEANVALAKSVELISKQIDEAPVDTCLFQYFFSRGIDLYFSRRYNEAMADLDRAITLSPESYEPYFYRGLLYRDIKAYDQARDSFSKAIELNEFFAEAYGGRSYIHYVLNNKQEGDRDLQRYKELSGKNISSSPKR
jgi:tetratricopeptide (TPR) repeat protein